MKTQIQIQKAIAELETERSKLQAELAAVTAELPGAEVKLEAAYAAEARGQNSPSVKSAVALADSLRTRQRALEAAVRSCEAELQTAHADLKSSKAADLRQRISDIEKQAGPLADKLEGLDVAREKAAGDLEALWNESRAALSQLAALEGDSQAVQFATVGTGISGPVGAFRNPIDALEYWRRNRHGQPANSGHPDWRPATLRAALFENFEQLAIRLKG